MSSAKSNVIELLDPRLVVPRARNPRIMSPARRAKLKRSLLRFGNAGGLAAHLDVDTGVYTWVGGHQRSAILVEVLNGGEPMLDDDGEPTEQTTELLERRGFLPAPVTVIRGLTIAEADMLCVVLNNQEAQGEWDFAALTSLLSDVDATGGVDITESAFDEAQLTRMLAPVGEMPAAFAEVDATTTPAQHTCPKCGFQFNDKSK